MDFEDGLRLVLRCEGGFANDANDPGGATKYGITQHTLSEWRGRPVSVEEVRNLTFEEVVPIYKQRYWDECRCGEMPEGLDLLLFDSAVNQGPNRAKRLLQESLGVAEDGVIGQVTMAAIHKLDSKALADELMSRRAVHYASLRSDFHLGWFRRLIDMHRRALG